MQMIKLPHKQHISHSQRHQRHHETNPMPSHKRQSSRGRKRRAEVYESQRHSKLQQGVEGSDFHVPNLKLIGHQLISVLAVRLTQVFVQQDAMHDGQTAVHAIDQQEDEICHIARRENQGADEKEEDICHSD